MSRFAYHRLMPPTPITASIVQRSKEFPYPAYLNDPLLTAVKTTVPLLLVLAYFYTAVRLAV